TSFATSRFHHDVAVCLVRPFVLPHTSSVACNKQSFKPVQMFSKSSASLLDSLACTFSTKRLCTSGSFRHHTFCLLTKIFSLFLDPCSKMCHTNQQPVLWNASLSWDYFHICQLCTITFSHQNIVNHCFAPPGFIRDLLCFVLFEHCVCNYQIHGTSKLQKQLTFYVTTAKPITTMYAMI